MPKPKTLSQEGIFDKFLILYPYAKKPDLFIYCIKYENNDTSRSKTKFLVESCSS